MNGGAHGRVQPDRDAPTRTRTRSSSRTRSQAYWNWAERYALTDRFFASAMGPSFPNHMYTIAATSGGALDNPWQPAPDLVGDAAGGLREVLGLRHRARRLRRDRRPRGLHGEGPAVLRLPDRGRPAEREGASRGPTTRRRTPSSATSGRRTRRSIATATTRSCGRTHIRPVDDVVRDIRAERLPPVTWITPRFQLSQHPEYNFCWGQNWSIAVVNAIMRSDDVEGHADRPHVGRLRRLLRPRPAGAAGSTSGLGSGSRRSCISPYAKRGFVDSHDVRVLERAPVHRGQLEPDPADERDRIARQPHRRARLRRQHPSDPCPSRCARTAGARSGTPRPRSS